MKRTFFLLATVLFTCLLSGQNLTEGFNCSTIIVGKDASASGNVLVGHNEDDGGTQVVNFYKSKAGDFPPDKIILKNGAATERESPSFASIWLEMPGQDFADSFLNENGVLITSNSCPSKESYGEIVDGGIGYNLRKIVAERARSARHGVEIAGELVSSFGYNASGRTYTIADTREAWMLSVVRGKHWVAMRIPDNQVVYLPNYYIIKEIDFEDSDNYMYSEGLIEYAQTRKWYDPSEGEFSFRDAYGSQRSAQSMSNIGRMWTGVNKLSSEKYNIDDEMPVSFVPSGLLTIADLVTVLRNHYEGTDLDDSELYTLHNPHANKVMNICAGHQQMSFVAELRDGLPVETGCRLWIAPRRGCVHAYMPVYFGIKEFPASFSYFDDSRKAYEMHFSVPEDMYSKNDDRAWWSFMEVTDYVDEDYSKRIGERRAYIKSLQDEYFELAEEFDSLIRDQWNTDREKAMKDIYQFNNMIFDKALKSNSEYLKNK